MRTREGEREKTGGDGEGWGHGRMAGTRVGRGKEEKGGEGKGSEGKSGPYGAYMQRTRRNVSKNQTDLGDEAAVEADDERIVGECENISLCERLLDLIAKYQVMFQQFLHGEQMPRLLVSNQVHAPVIHHRTTPSKQPTLMRPLVAL